MMMMRPVRMPTPWRHVLPTPAPLTDDAAASRFIGTTSCCQGQEFVGQERRDSRTLPLVLGKDGFNRNLAAFVINDTPQALTHLSASVVCKGNNGDEHRVAHRVFPADVLARNPARACDFRPEYTNQCVAVFFIALVRRDNQLIVFVNEGQVKKKNRNNGDVSGKTIYVKLDFQRAYDSGPQRVRSTDIKWQTKLNLKNKPELQKLRPLFAKVYRVHQAVFIRSVLRNAELDPESLPRHFGDIHYLCTHGASKAETYLRTHTGDLSAKTAESLLDAALGDLGLELDLLCSNDFSTWITFSSTENQPEAVSGNGAISVVPPSLQDLGSALLSPAASAQPGSSSATTSSITEARSSPAFPGEDGDLAAHVSSLSSLDENLLALMDVGLQPRALSRSNSTNSLLDGPYDDLGFDIFGGFELVPEDALAWPMEASTATNSTVDDPPFHFDAAFSPAHANRETRPRDTPASNSPLKRRRQGE